MKVTLAKDFLPRGCSLELTGCMAPILQAVPRGQGSVEALEGGGPSEQRLQLRN